MKDRKKERSKKVVEFTRKKRSWLRDLIVGFVSLVIIFAVLIMIDAYKERVQKRAEEELASQMEETISSAEEKVETELMELSVTAEEKDYYDTYFFGATGASGILILQDDVIQFYMSDDITEEQLKEYVETKRNIINLALSDSGVPVEEIEKYNDIIREIPLINYDSFQLESTGENFWQGFKGWLVAIACRQIVDYYQEQIPEEKYNSFAIIVNRNINSHKEENTVRIIDYGKKLIEDYIGDPDEVLVSDDWKVFTDIPEK